MMEMLRIDRASAKRAIWFGLACCLTAAAAVFVVDRVEPSRALDVVAVFAGIVVVAVVFTMPVHWIPAFALVIYGIGASAFIPSAIPLPVPPPVALLLVWVLRRIFQSLRSSRSSESHGGRVEGAQMVALLLVAWSLISMFFAPLGMSGTAWVISFATAVVVPMLVSGSEREAAALTRVWIVLGAVLGLYALLEVALGQNFLYWSLGRESSQHWSSYRAEGPFGHPLLFATFLVVAFGLAIGQWLSRGGRGTLWAGVAALAGVVVTLSRGALVAAVVAFLFAYFLASARRGVATWRRIVTLGVLAAIGTGIILIASPIVDRWTSDEAAGSTAARDRVWAVVAESVSDTLGLGTGPGTSAVAAAGLGFSLPVENSMFQILVSLGVPGLVLFLLLIGLAVRTALKHSSLAAAAGLVAYVVAITGYNSIDDRRSAHILLGLLLVIALFSRPSKPSAESTALQVNRRSL